MGACKAKCACSSKLPVYKTLVNESFSLLTAFRKLEKPTKESKKHRFLVLQNHVKLHTKVLIDHIASNREKLVETMLYIRRIIDEHTNIEYHLIAFFIVIELASNMHKLKQKSLKVYDTGHDEGTLRIRDDSLIFEHPENDDTMIRIDENVFKKKKSAGLRGF